MPTFNYPIRVPADVLEALGAFTGHNWSDTLALEPFICDAIRNYLRPTPATQAQAQPVHSSSAGYQWKQLFLPEGTRLRASFGGFSYFAQVEGESIKFGGQAVSPSRFANLQGSGNRNAWKAIWLCLPGSDDWLLADVCRAARTAAITRLLGGSAQAERPPQERERRTAERRTASRPARLTRLHAQHQRARRNASLRRSGPHHNEPGARGLPLALAAMESNDSQFKNGSKRGSRRRRAKYHGPGKP